jgi:two-component system NtrC family response regulator
MKPRESILLIDDEPGLRKMIARLLTSEGYEVTEAEDLRSAWKHLGHLRFPVVLCDVKLPDGHGVDAVPEILTKHPLTEVILLTAYGNIPDGVRAIQNGAFNYLVKGDDNARLLPLVSQAMASALDKERRAKKAPNTGSYTFDDLVGESLAIRQAIELARKVARTDATVLLTGETGTGKELFASAIHRAGNRKDKPFVAVNCSAFSHELLESELFGHRAGSFTGATKDKHGIVEEARGGTLLLDEVGEMPLDLQAKLLRFLENGEYLRVGDTKPVQADVRVIAATNRNLGAEAEKGRFRGDLFYRLSAFQIHLPSLRDRREDIPALADLFLRHHAAKMNIHVTSMSPAFLLALKRHEWKGNIRELRNVIERAVILAGSSSLDVDCLPFEWSSDQVVNRPETLDMASMEKRHIARVLSHTGGNKTEAARVLNIGLTTLYRKIEEYGIPLH